MNSYVAPAAAFVSREGSRVAESAAATCRGDISTASPIRCPMPHAAVLPIHGRAGDADDDAAFGVHSRRLRGVPVAHAARREFPKPVTRVRGDEMQTRDSRVSGVGTIIRMYCEPPLILEPRLSRDDPHSRTALHEGYFGLAFPIFGVPISTRLRGRLPTGRPVDRARFPAEEGGKGWRRLGR